MLLLLLLLVVVVESPAVDLLSNDLLILERDLAEDGCDF
jgi:hypothetical protein